MKKISMVAALAALMMGSAAAQADISVFSANGFVCGKEGQTVTCKGKHPLNNDTITATGHNLVYLTINTQQDGAPVRYTYFSDTGCLIGYTFNAAGQPANAVVSHRKGAKQTFNFANKDDYEKVTNFCVADQPAGTDNAKTAAAPAK